VFDDFAHHPTAIATTLAGMKAAESGRLLAVLEPRSNTMRLGVHRDALGSALTDADAVFVYRPADLEWDLTAALDSLKIPASVHDNLDAVIEAVARAARPGDRIVVMSNGSFGGIHEKLLSAMAG
jgi:UDP-N-acetylmuramate: L-alanyl-gamma-D-glutamyl-meso-diaminopimelate ligase